MMAFQEDIFIIILCFTGGKMANYNITINFVTFLTIYIIVSVFIIVCGVSGLSVRCVCVIVIVIVVSGLFVCYLS